MSKKKRKAVETKIYYLAIGILALVIGLIFSVYNIIQDTRRLPSLLTTKKDLAVRGNIYSADNFKIATSKKIFSASVDTRSIDPNKKELFITLFSIYSNIPKEKIRKRIDSRRGFVYISRDIDQRVAKDLKSLKYKLLNLKVFRRIMINGVERLYGLTIVENGEDRIYPYNDALTPLIGYMKKNNTKAGKQRVKGVKGIEKEFNDQLNDMQDGILKGDRDVSSYIIFNKNSQIIQRRDGKNIYLTIPLKLQRNIELMVDRYKKKLEAKEIIVSVMESDTGKVLALASSNRYNPNRILQKDIQNLNVNAIEFQYEPGSVIKPLAMALALKHNKVKENELFYAYNKGRINRKGEYPKGRLKLGKWTIRDDHQFKKHYITLDDIIVYSSNIGTAIVANRLSGEEFYNGLKDFGLSKKTGIELPYEKKGLIHKLYQYNAKSKKYKLNVYKGTDAYGQGILVTFMQLIKAYSTFNNNGNIVTPYITLYHNKKSSQNILSSQIANKIKALLIKTVEEGTGTKAQVEGLEIGGKTGTATTVKNRRYQKKYISSFFGFANDINHKYTIGVTVREPVATGKHWYYYYASHSAVPVFRETVKILLKLNYLKQNSTIQ